MKAAHARVAKIDMESRLATALPFSRGGFLSNPRFSENEGFLPMNAHERVETLARERILAKGLKVERRGACWRVYGAGVDLLTAQLAQLSDLDLQKAWPKIERRFYTER